MIMLKKLLAVFIVFSILASFVSCQKKEFDIYLPLDNYDDLQYVWSHKQENTGPYYTFEENIGDGIKVVYTFVNYKVFEPMPKTIDEYLEICTPLGFVTYVFFTEKNVCEGKEHKGHIAGVHTFPQSLQEYAKYPFISLTAESVNDPIIIEDISLVTYISSGEGERLEYLLSYNGYPFLTLEGCAQLSEEDIATLVQHLVVLEK